MITLPNGNSIDLNMLEAAMEDARSGEQVFLEPGLGRSGLFFRLCRPDRRG
jgi:hypothetical protein